MRQTAGHVNPKKPLVRKNRDREPPTKCSGITFVALRLNYENNSYETNYTIKIDLMGNASGQADRRMTQVTQLSLFTNILPMSLRVLHLHPVLCSVSAKY